jgi:hypothetical protein
MVEQGYGFLGATALTVEVESVPKDEIADFKRSFRQTFNFREPDSPVDHKNRTFPKKSLKQHISPQRIIVKRRIWIIFMPEKRRRV